MPSPKPLDDNKIMDIAKPGKSKPVSTSRPVITTHPTLPKEQNSPGAKVDSINGADAVAPSQSRKVISPITLDVKPEAPADVKVSKKPVAKPVEDEVAAKIAEVLEPSTPAAEQKDAKEESTFVTAGVDTSKTDETNEAAGQVEGTSENASETAPESTSETVDEPQEEAAPESVPAPEPEQEPEPEAPTESGSNETAEIEALADATVAQKLTEKQAEEQAKRDAEVQQLITSKKYFVPLAHDSSKKHTSKAPAVIILILILLAAGAYAVVDLGLVKPGFDVPYHVLKK